MTNRVVSERDELRLTIDWLTSAVNTRTKLKNRAPISVSVAAAQRIVGWLEQVAEREEGQ